MKKKPKLTFRISLKKIKTKKNEKDYEIKIDRKLDLNEPIRFNEPVPVKLEDSIPLKIKDNWKDNLSKYAGLAAVLVALFTVIFDCSQSRIQEKVFNDFKDSLNSVFRQQMVLSKEQHVSTITVMNQQSDSTIKMMKIQADRLKAQNDIWKINQKNKTLTERAIVSPILTEYLFKDDSLSFKFNYTNSGEREAINVECKIGGFIVNDHGISLLFDSIAPFSYNKIAPRGGNIYWGKNNRFKQLKVINNVFIYSSITYADEMFEKPFTKTDFVQIHKSDSVNTLISFCSQTQIEFFEKFSHYRDIEIEDYTIKREFLFDQ